MRPIMLAVAALLVASLLSACADRSGADDDSWDIEGPLLAWDAGIWIVDAVPIVVPDHVALNGDLILGATVTASGTFDDTGRRVAEAISLEAGPLPESTLPDVTVSGTIDQVDGNTWIVDGQEIVVADGTQISSAEPGLDAQLLFQIGNLADVSANRMDDGRIVAREISLRLPAETEQPEPTTDPGAEQPEPAPPATDDDDGSDNGDDNRDDGDDDDGRKDDDKPDKPEKPDKPDKPDDDDDDDDD